MADTKEKSGGPSRIRNVIDIGGEASPREKDDIFSGMRTYSKQTPKSDILHGSLIPTMTSVGEDGENPLNLEKPNRGRKSGKAVSEKRNSFPAVLWSNFSKILNVNPEDPPSIREYMRNVSTSRNSLPVVKKTLSTNRMEAIELSVKDLQNAKNVPLKVSKKIQSPTSVGKVTPSPVETTENKSPLKVSGKRKFIPEQAQHSPSNTRASTRATTSQKVLEDVKSVVSKRSQLQTKQKNAPTKNINLFTRSSKVPQANSMKTEVEDDQSMDENSGVISKKKGRPKKSSGKASNPEFQPVVIMQKLDLNVPSDSDDEADEVKLTTSRNTKSRNTDIKVDKESKAFVEKRVLRSPDKTGAKNITIIEKSPKKRVTERQHEVRSSSRLASLSASKIKKETKKPEPKSIKRENESSSIKSQEGAVITPKRARTSSKSTEVISQTPTKTPRRSTSTEKVNPGSSSVKVDTPNKPSTTLKVVDPKAFQVVVPKSPFKPDFTSTPSSSSLQQKRIITLTPDMLKLLRQQSKPGPSTNQNKPVKVIQVTPEIMKKLANMKQTMGALPPTVKAALGAPEDRTSQKRREEPIMGINSPAKKIPKVLSPSRSNTPTTIQLQMSPSKSSYHDVKPKVSSNTHHMKPNPDSLKVNAKITNLESSMSTKTAGSPRVIKLTPDILEKLKKSLPGNSNLNRFAVSMNQFKLLQGSNASPTQKSKQNIVIVPRTPGSAAAAASSSSSGLNITLVRPTPANVDHKVSSSNQSTVKNAAVKEVKKGGNIIYYGMEELLRDDQRRKEEKKALAIKEKVLRKLIAKYEEKEMKKKQKFLAKRREKIMQKALLKFKNDMKAERNLKPNEDQPARRQPRNLLMATARKTVTRREPRLNANSGNASMASAENSAAEARDKSSKTASPLKCKPSPSKGTVISNLSLDFLKPYQIKSPPLISKNVQVPLAPGKHVLMKDDAYFTGMSTSISNKSDRQTYSRLQKSTNIARSGGNVAVKDPFSIASHSAGETFTMDCPCTLSGNPCTCHA